MAILVNGNGNARVYAAQDADLIASITGNTTVRTSVGNKMAATAADASTISVADGVILTKEGRRIQLDAGQTDLFTIPTGSAGVTNYYIIGYKLTTNSDNVQVAETFVQLMASSTDTIPEGTFRGGDSDVYVSVARVEQDGVNLGTITALLPELETISELNNDLGNLSDLDTEDKSSIVNAINETIGAKVIATITADGVKTWNALLSELYSYVDAMTEFERLRSVVSVRDQHYARFVKNANSVYTYSLSHQISTTQASIINLEIGNLSSNSHFYGIVLANNSVVVRDDGVGNVPASGTKVKLLIV